MIISQTPLRISFFGGGTDFRDFYSHEEGSVLSSTIDKYIYVIIKERFDDKLRIGYTRTELADSVDEIQHELVRECLRKTGITHGAEINTMGDIPAAWSGLGSSSSVTVGLLNAMYHYLGTPKEPEVLAREACEIEVDTLCKPIGKQDQYIAAYGNLRQIHFHRDESISTQCLGLEDGLQRRLTRRLMLFFTSIERKSESVLTEQVNNISARMDVLCYLKELAYKARAALEAGELDALGLMLHESWEAKKQLASNVSNPIIDDIYSRARHAGALGGKITGAGGGGFLLLYCRPEDQDNVRAELAHLRELPFKLERDGSKVIFNYRR